MSTEVLSGLGLLLLIGGIAFITYLVWVYTLTWDSYNDRETTFNQYLRGIHAYRGVPEETEILIGGAREDYMKGVLSKEQFDKLINLRKELY